MMTNLVLRNTTPVQNRSLPKSFHTYIIIDKDRGVKIGEVKYAYRPKNAGGRAWQALVQRDGQPAGCVGYSYYSPTLEKLCEIVRHAYTGEGSAPRHWR